MSVNFTVWETTLDYLQKEEYDITVGHLLPFIAGAISGLVATTVAYPYDTGELSFCFDSCSLSFDYVHFSEENCSNPNRRRQQIYFGLQESKRKWAFGFLSRTQVELHISYPFGFTFFRVLETRKILF